MNKNGYMEKCRKENIENRAGMSCVDAAVSGASIFDIYIFRRFSIQPNLTDQQFGNVKFL